MTEMIKPKRLIVGSLLASGLLLFYLWQQDGSGNPTRIIRTVQHSNNVLHLYKNANETQWTWKCTNQRCERYLFSQNGEHPSSLETCNMLCGSTQLWPQPTGPVSLGSHPVSINPETLKLEFVLPEPSQTFISKAFDIFKENVKTLLVVPSPPQERYDVSSFTVKIDVADTNHMKLRLGTDERYTLIVKLHDFNQIVVNITSKTIFGARHGLETLSQLIWFDDVDQKLKIISGAKIQDGPVFSYRGLMVDTSRNFIPLDYLKRTLVGMAANKLNVFHWHMSDSQSFPWASRRVPEMARTGAYAFDKVYTNEDVKNLVQFAKERGIRTVLEIDIPAHAGNGWGWGPEKEFGELAVCINEQPWATYCGEPPCGQLNPLNPNTYDVLENLFREIIELTEENEIFHLGGDEVNLECWSQLQRIDSNLSPFTDAVDIWGNFTLEAMQRLTKANGGTLPPNVLFWTSHLNSRQHLHKYYKQHNSVMQVWGPLEWGEAKSLIDEGYRVLISHVNSWYLDCGFGPWRETGFAACDPYRPWQSVYSHRPWHSEQLDTKYVIGGEACLWTEQVDAESLDSRLWPRGAAFAERMWSDPESNADEGIAEDVYTRLSTQRDRLVKRV